LVLASRFLVLAARLAELRALAQVAELPCGWGY